MPITQYGREKEAYNTVWEREGERETYNTVWEREGDL